MSTVTAAEVLATARSVYDMGLIYREAYDWTSYVSIQEKAPYNDGRFPRGVSIAHCGVSVAYVLWRAGMVAGVDYPDLTAMQFAPYLAQRINVVGDPEPGDIVVFDFQHDGVEDHIGLAVDTSGLAAGTITVWQANSIPGGRVIYADVPTSWIAGYVRPDYADAPAASGGFVQTTPEGRFIQWWVDNTDLPLAAIAGIAGNVQQESSFNPRAVEKAEQGYTLETLDRVAGPNANAAGYGLFQDSFDRLWADDGLLLWGAANGFDPHTLEGQNTYAVWELRNRPRFAGLWDELAAQTDAYQAALVFGKFEGFNPAFEGLRNQYAVALWGRMVAGEFGPLDRSATIIDNARRAVAAYA